MDRAKLLDSFVNSIPDPVVIAGTDHTVLYFNRAALELFKGSEPPVGRSLFDCHNPQSRRKIEAVLERLQDGEDEVQITTRQGKDPENRQHTFMRAVRNGDGELIGYYERYMYWDKRID